MLRYCIRNSFDSCGRTESGIELIMQKIADEKMQSKSGTSMKSLASVKISKTEI
jgi:hypothetical protein